MSQKTIEQKIDELHRFWFDPPILGQPSRAAQVDEMLTLSRNLRFTRRALIWAGAGVVGLGSLFLKFGPFLRGE